MADCRVYIRKFPFENNKNIYCKQRLKEIESCESDKVRQEKYYVWLLLEEMLQEYLCKDITEIKFSKGGDKWLCEDCYFSLSHSDDIVAIALSESNVGIDLEKVSLSKFTDRFAKKILTQDEMDEYDSLKCNRAEYLNRKWCGKEAYFKWSGCKEFVPNQIYCKDCAVKTLESKESEYFVAVVADRRIDWNVFDLKIVK